MSDHIAEEHASRQRPYIIGLVLSVLLTSLAFFMVEQYLSGNSGLSRGVLRLFIAGTALTQAAVQLYFFLHLGKGAASRWRLLIFLFTLGVIAIIVFGSLWIMDNLNYRMMRMTPEQTKTYMHKEEGI